jgi:hypothetical protein
MNFLLSYGQFKQMRDQGKFSKKFEGRHSYFLYLDKEKIKKNTICFEEYPSPIIDRPTPKYVLPKESTFVDKYFNNKNIPNKYNINS